ncbi:hypothetical protein V1512DRAFT_288819 [Lipomyces arxii]|uniref:uncharacterized protein n=1 Tax=Lipomyces arxii TaxID=56418 RepID=UPI0034CDAE6D
MSDLPTASKFGPTLPPHVLAAREAKRKRLAEAKEAASKGNSDKTQSTSLALDASGDSKKESEEKSEDVHVKKVRVIGPSMGPFVCPTRPDREPNLSEEEEERPKSHLYIPNLNKKRESEDERKPTTNSNGRDEWMTLPPSRGDWAAKQADPLSLRNRKFMIGSSASLAGRDADSSWNETDAERKKRIAEEMMGLRKRNEPGPAVRTDEPSGRDQELARQVEEYNSQVRNKSLMEEFREQSSNQSGKNEHAKVKGPDDPSKRGFDYEKDVASAGQTIGGTQINEFVKRASEMDSKFSKGRYL